MNYLLDTCALLWLVNGDARLSPRARQAIADPQATIFLSKRNYAPLPLPVWPDLNDTHPEFDGPALSARSFEPNSLFVTHE